MKKEQTTQINLGFPKGKTDSVFGTLSKLRGTKVEGLFPAGVFEKHLSDMEQDLKTEKSLDK